LMKLIESKHNVFIEYNPYNKEIKVYKHKIITKLLPGLDKKKIESSFNGILSYDQKLKKENSYYIDKGGFIVIKTDYLNYYSVLNILNTLKYSNMKNVNIEFDYIRVKSLDKIPFAKIKEEILNCGNFECLKAVLENYGTISISERESVTSKIGENGFVVFGRNSNNTVKLKYKIEMFDFLGNTFLVNYSLYDRKKEYVLVQSSLSAKQFTYVPVFVKRDRQSDGFFINNYYILKISNSIF
jgi:hypothetical protein